MPYSQFTIEQIKTNFGISISEQFRTFAEVAEINYSDFLAQSLNLHSCAIAASRDFLTRVSRRALPNAKGECDRFKYQSACIQYLVK